jgi:hypothetical protein
MKKSPQLVTEAVNDLYLPADSMSNRPGIIYAANEERFTASHYSEPLTAYTVGWRDPENLDALLETIAPAVSVGRRFEFKKADNAQAFLSEDDDVRAIGSAFKRVEYKGSTVNEKTLNKGLTIRLDKDDLLGAGDEELSVNRLMQRLSRNEVRRALALLAAAATNTNKTWNSSANPDKDVRDRLKASADKSGIRPNRVLFAENAWDLRLDVYEAVNTPYAGRAASMTKEQLAAKYMVDIVEVVKARYQSTLTAKASVQTTLTLLMFLAISGSGKDDPSTIKRFVTPIGSRYRVYRQESDKFIDISVEHYSNSVITSDIGVEQLTVAAS